MTNTPAPAPAPADLGAALAWRLVGPILDTRKMAAAGLFPDDEDAHLAAEEYAALVNAYLAADLAETEAVAALAAMPSLEARVEAAIREHGVLSAERSRDLAREHREEGDRLADAATVARTARNSYLRPLVTTVGDLVASARELREDTDGLVAVAAEPALDRVDECRKALARAEADLRRVLSVGAYVRRLAEMDLTGDSLPSLDGLPALEVAEPEADAPASTRRKPTAKG